MDYTHIIEELDKASLFDLYRLQAAINNEIDNPKRIKEVKNSLQVGQEVTWFDETTNNLEKAIIRKFTNSRCEVKNLSDGRVWRILYASINIENSDVTIKSKQKSGVKKSALKVGDIVSFLDNQHKLLYAKVLKLNPKTAGVLTMENQNWRVSYDSLSINTDIEGTIIMDSIVQKNNF